MKREALETAYQADIENENLREKVRELKAQAETSKDQLKHTLSQQRQLADSASMTPAATVTPASFLSRVTGVTAGADRVLLSHFRSRLSSGGTQPTLDELSCQLFERELELSEKQVRNRVREKVSQTYTSLDVRTECYSGPTPDFYVSCRCTEVPVVLDVLEFKSLVVRGYVILTLNDQCC